MRANGVANLDLPSQNFRWKQSDSRPEPIGKADLELRCLEVEGRLGTFQRRRCGIVQVSHDHYDNNELAEVYNLHQDVKRQLFFRNI